MIKRFLKSSVTLLIILGVTFSNVPFYALSGLVDSYAKTKGVVDRMWLVQHENNPDVVDKFASLRDVAEKMKIRQAKAATLTIVLNNRQTILTEGTSWTVPADWTSANNTIEVIGGGGSGFTDTTGIAGAGGGGGGAYSKITNLTLTPGATVTYQIGNGGKNAVLNGGDTFFNRTAGVAGTCVDTTSVCAKGGTGATSVTGAAGGVGTSGTGTVRNNGGTGGTGNTTGDTGGGGGGAAGPGAVGKTGGAGGALAGGGSGGGGGNGGVSSTAGIAGSTTVGGAGGAGNLGTGGGTAGSAAAGGNGTTSGAGGGGGDSTFSGGNGFAGTDFFSGATVGSGGGGGGASSNAKVGVGGNGGLYGAGGGGGRYGGKGAPGVVVITYNGLTPTKTQWTVPSDWDNANNTIEVIGAGGSAFSAAQGAGTSGGGGGAYSKATNVTLTPSATVAYAIGNGGRKTVVGFGAGVAGGDTYLCNATTNCASIAGTAVIAGAKGGAAGVSSTAGGAGGAAASGFPVAGTRWSGGAGGAGNATGDSGGGGGGAGGATQDGKVGGIGYTAASGGGGGGGGAGDDSGVNSTVGGAGVAANGGAGGQGPLGTGSGAAGANGSGGNATPGTGAGGGAGDAASVAGPFNGGDGAYGSAPAYGGGGGGGTGDSNLVATGALFGGEGGYFGGGGGAGLNPGFGGNGGIIITYTQLVLSTTLATGSDPGAGIIIAPGAGAQDVDLFTLQTNSGTESVTTVTVNLSTNSGVGRLAITDNANSELGFTTSPATGSNVITVAGMSAGTGVTTFKVRATPLSHATMLAPAGGAYSITAPVTAWAGNYATHAGSDTNTNALTIDNNSPVGTTGAGATSAENAQSTVSWTNPGDGDFQQIYIYCKTSTMGSGEAPAEGADPAVDATACDATARMKYKGTASPQTITSLTNGTPYYFRIYGRDTNGNFTAYSATQEVTGTPSAPANNLTISQTAGSKAATKNSGDVNQYAHDTACTGAGTCSAFTLASAGGTSNVTSIKITENGTVTANTELSDLNLYYDYDGNWADAGAETLFGTVANFAGDQTATVSGTLAITAGATAYIYARYDLANGAVYPTGGATVNFQIAAFGDVVSDATESGTGTLVGTTTVKPQITGYTNSTEPALDYAGACTGCGARIGGGSGFRHTLVISGYGFGADPGLGSRDTATNKVEIAGTATTVLADDASANTNVSAWSNTSITIRTDSTIATNTDTDFGTNFGGAVALKVTAGGQAVPTNLNFYIFPQVTSVNGVSADQMREYNAGDTDGIITLTGTRFGTTGTGGFVRILGCDATTCSSPTGTVTAVADATCDVVDGWANTCIKVQVPVVIANNLYTGSIAMQQGAGSNNKTNSYSGIRILPRITSLVPSNGTVGASVTVNSDHLCQAGTASCPVAFGANDKVTFNSGVVATSWGTWSDTAIVTAVPTGAVTGSVSITSNAPPAYTSNVLTFTVDANTTTLATGSDPAVNTIAPGASATDVDLFTLQTNGGTESVTSVTVNLSTNSGVGTLAITDNAGTVLGSIGGGIGTGIVTGSNTISVAGMSAVSGSATSFKVRVTPLSHTNMPAPAGASYSLTAPVTAWAGSNTHTGSDTNTNALTIDNTSPANVTSASASAGDAQVSLSWTIPVDSDFHSTIVLRRTTSVVTDVPAEGTTYIVGDPVGASTVACVVATPTAVCTDSGLTNGTPYYYKIFTKDSRVNYSVTGVVPTGSPVTPTLTQTLTVGTVGTQATNLNSGSTAQHIGGAGTAAFTLQINTGSSNVTSVKVSETGTALMANLANPKLYYENAVNSASCAYGGAESFVSGAAPVGETVTFTLPSVAVGLTANVTCLYFVSDVTSSAAGGQTIELQITNPSTDVVVSAGVNTDAVAKTITGTTTVKPQITGYTNSTEAALNYANCGTTGCGARIGGGSGFRHTLVISGYGFGADPGLGSRDTATNKVEIAGTATTVLADDASANTNVSAWSNTSITIRTDSTIATNTDTDFGTNFGGAVALKVTAGGQAVPTNLNFYIFPQVTGVNGVTADQMREYNAGDTDGIITLTGTRFGTTGTGGFVRILGCDATTCSSPTGTVTAVADATCDVVDGWANTCIKVQVPVVIANNLYTGSIAMQQGAGSNNKTNSYSGLRVLPRITSLSPSSASINDLITVNGNHFCQSGTCPVAFGANDKVTFNSGIVATYWGAGGWTDTAIDTKVPTGATTGDVFVTSNIPPAYTSNVTTFTLVSTTPGLPTNLKQYKTDGTTEISAGGTASTTSVVLKANLSADIAINMIIQVEVEDVFTGFDGIGIVDGSVGGGGGCTSCSTLVNAQVTVSGLTDNIKHWRARAKNTTTSEVSAWEYYGTSSTNETDFKIDTTAPVITGTSSGTPGTNSASITWTTSGEISTTRIEYDIAGTFTGGYDCAGTSECTALTDTSPMVNSHAPPSLSNLNSGITYHYRVRSKDVAGNETIGPATGDYTFLTQTENKPAKTTRFHIVGKTSEVTNGSPLNQTFSVFMPELATSTKSAFVEIVGVYTTTAGSPTITVQVNSETSKAYALPPVSATSHFKILHQVSSVIVETANANTLTVTPNTNTSIFINSADINVNYSYTP